MPIILDDGEISALETILGTTTDASVVTNAAGTVSGKIRGLVTLLAALTAADDAAKPASALAAGGVYQSTVDEVDANDLGQLRMTCRRAALTAADYKGLALTNSTPVPTDSDVTNASGDALTANDFSIRDTATHGYLIPKNSRGWRQITLALQETAAFDQTATITLFVRVAASGPFSSLAMFNLPICAGWRMVIGDSGNVGVGGLAATATPTPYAFASVPALAGCYSEVRLQIQFSVAPTTGNVNLYVDRST